MSMLVSHPPAGSLMHGSFAFSDNRMSVCTWNDSHSKVLVIHKFERSFQAFTCRDYYIGT